MLRWRRRQLAYRRTGREGGVSSPVPSIAIPVIVPLLFAPSTLISLVLLMMSMCSNILSKIHQRLVDITAWSRALARSKDWARSLLNIP